jgi:light-regulated signal transduction histidine kinase (bacteriophytochrome)
MSGFSQAVLEDCGAGLDERSRDYLGRIQSAAEKMGRLIDDLLALSRTGRAALRPGPVDLSVLAREILAELRRGEPERRVEWVVQDGLQTLGDETLLRVALTNLLANAWKFTARRPDARIEFGAADQDGGRVFFVRDNGAGFDMAYADKLFGVFTRLHGEADFPGTGIGLATVHRIVARHGGRVWAEGKVGAGATFYFVFGAVTAGAAEGPESPGPASPPGL